VLSPQSADRAEKQATADKFKFNLLVDANNESGRPSARLHFPRGPEERALAGASQLLSTNWRHRGKQLDRPMSHCRLAFRLGAPVNDCDFRDGSDPVFEQCHPHSDQQADIARSVGYPSADIWVPSNGVSARVLFEGVMLTFTDDLFGNRRPLTLGNVGALGVTQLGVAP